MSCYLSFLDKEVFEGASPLEGMLTSPVEEAETHSVMAIATITPKEQAAKETSQKLTKERKCPKFPGWEKVLHPSQPAVVAGQPPHLLRSPEQTYPLMANWNQPTKIVPTEIPSPMQELEVAHRWMPTSSFLGVTTCVRGQLPKDVPKAPSVPLAVGMMTALGVATISASHVVATYLDTVTTSVGRVTLSGLEGKIPAQGPKIEDVTDFV